MSVARPLLRLSPGWPRGLLAALLGPNPWPAAGAAGYLAELVVVLAAVVALVLATPGVARGDRFYRFYTDDFLAYFTGATLVATGEVRQLYHHQRQLDVQAALVRPLGEKAPGLEYVYPPLWAAAIAPLYPLGLLTAGWLWRLIGLLVAGWVLVAVAERGGPRPGIRRSALLALAFYPFVLGWLYGSMVALLVLAFGGWFVLARANRPRLAGLALSLLLLKPQYLPFLLAYLVWKRQWRQLQGWAIGAGLQLLASVLLLLSGDGPLVVDALQPFVAFDGGPSNSGLQVQATLRSALWPLLRDLGPATQYGLLAAVTLVCFAAVLGLLGRGWDLARRGGAWEVLAVAAAAGLTAYYSHQTGLVLLLPPMVALLSQPRHEHRQAALLVAVLAGLLALPSLGLFVSGIEPSGYVQAGRLAALGCLGLGVLGARGALARPPAGR